MGRPQFAEVIKIFDKPDVKNKNAKMSMINLLASLV